MKWSLSAALLLVMLAGTSSASEYIWREGENATSTTFNHHSWYEGSANIDKTLLSPGMPGGAQGAWYAHYVTGSNSPAYVQWNNVNVTEGGTYTWWVRLAPTNTSYTYSIDGGAAVSMDISRQHEVIDPARPGLMDDVHFLSWVQVGDISLSAGTHTIRITAVYNAPHDSTIGAVDCMCLLNFPWTPTGSLQPGGATNPDPTPGPGVWFPLHVGEDAFSAQSIIDMRALIAATTGVPAGVNGHVTRVQDHFELSGQPGTPVKFWGICATKPSSYLGTGPAMTSLFEQQARYYAKHGINLLRRHPMIDELGQSPTGAAYDAYDQWFKALKDNGIYTDWSVFYPDSTSLTRSFLPTTPDSAFTALIARAGVTLDQLWNELPAGSGSGTKKLGGMDCFVEWYQEGEWNWERNLLQHTNPYTGLQYVNDPALAIVEVQNEDSIFWWWPLSNLADPSGGSGTYYTYHARLLTRMWFEWLQAKYANDAALSAAWGAGKKANDSVETFYPDMTLYTPWHMADDGVPYAPNDKARMADYIRFLAETQRAIYQKRFDNLTALGYQGIKVTTGWQAGGPTGKPANLWTDDAGDAIDRHAYMGGETAGSGWYVAPGGVRNDIQLSAPGRFILGAESFATTLGNTSLFQVEDKPAIMTEWDDVLPTKWRAEMAPMFAFYGMGLQGWDASLHFAGSHAWMETGWPGQFFGPGPFISDTPVYMAQFPALAFAVYHGHIQQGDIAAARRISLTDLFSGVDPLSQPLANGGYAGQNNIYTPPEVMAIGRMTFKADNSLTSSDSVKSNWNTYWNQTTKVITSNTGQLVWDYNNRVVQVKTPKTQALIGWSGGKGAYDLGGVQVSVNAATPFASIIFTPLDDLPLTTSSHILVTALAQDTEAGASYSSDTNLSSIGGPPLYLQPVQASITMGGDTVADVHVVDVYGVPTGQTVPVAGNAFTINGNYSTYYYEINRAATPQPAIVRSPTTLSASCVQGASPADGSFQVWNSGSAALNYTIADDAGWLSVNPASGTSNDAADKQTHTVSYSAGALAAGTYNATITVTDATASNSPQTIPVTLTVQSPPSIALSTTALNPSCTVGADAGNQTFQVWDAGGAPLSYTVSDDGAWLGVSPGSGTSTGTGDKKTHTVSYSTSGLTVGTYDATITVAAPGASNTPRTVAVHLTVLPAPASIGRSPTSLAPSCVHGANTADQTFQVWDAGGGTLSYTITDNAAWLSVAPDNGSSTGVGDKVTHTVSYATSGLTPGTYNATITITAAGVPNSPQTILVQLTVQPAPPAISLSTAALSPFCAQTQNALSQTFQVWNGSDGTLTYSISDDVAWLSVSPDNGTSTGSGDKKTHTITYSTSALAQGDYYATITVSDAGAANTPQTIAVHLSVLSAPPAISVSAASLSPACATGQNAPSQPLDIWNGGEGTLAYTVYSSVAGGPSWLSISPGVGSSTGDADKVTHTVTYSTSGLSPGVYDATIVITSVGAANTPQSVPVTLTVGATASIGLDKTSLSPATALGGSPPDEQFQVWNAAAGTMDYTITDDAAWLGVLPAGGSSTGAGDVHAHTVSYSTAGLSPGTYDATITVAAVGADNTPRSIAVHLTVQDNTGPLIHITWPREADSPLSDPMIIVTGTANDSSGIQAIWVNGVGALSTGAGFSTWQATIPLNQGWDGSDPNRVNTITASGVDADGNYTSDGDSVTVDSIGGGGLVRLVGLGFQASGAVVPGDVDTFQFEAVAGTSLTLSLKGSGKPAPSMRLVLYDTFCQQMLSQTGASISVRQTLPGSGLYTFCISPASGDGGQYQLKLSGRLPKASMKQNGGLVSASAEAPYTMALAKGSTLNMAASSKAFQPMLTLMDPVGHVIPMGGYQVGSNGKAQVKGMPLPGGSEPYLTGDYTVCITSGNGSSGAFSLTCSAKSPKPAKEKVLYPALLGTSAKSGVARGAQLQLKVTGASDTLSRNAVYLAGQRLSVDSASLKGGKGSLYVTVPVDAIVGTVEVYFVRSDSQVDEKSNLASVEITVP